MKYRVVPVNTRQPEVVQLLVWLQKACLPADKIYPITQGHWYVAYAQDGEAVGFAGVVPSARWADTMYLCRSGVVLAHRGRGLQKRLIKARIRKARRCSGTGCRGDRPPPSLPPASWWHRWLT